MIQPIHEQGFLIQGLNLHRYNLPDPQAAAVGHQTVQGLGPLDKDIGYGFSPQFKSRVCGMGNGPETGML